MFTVYAQREAERVSLHLQRAKSAGVPATLTLEEWLAILEKYNGLCAHCKEKPFEVLDHFIPIAAMGGTTADNCLPACQACNAHKGSRIGNEPAEDMKRQTVYMPKRLATRLKIHAAATGKDISGIITQLVESYLDDAERNK